MNKLNTHKTKASFEKLKLVIMRRIANNTVNYFQGRVFDTQGTALGSRWKPSKRSLKDGGKTLQKTGRGKRSISDRVISEKRAIISPRVSYMNKHQLGLDGLPERKFMGNSRELFNQNKKIIVKAMKRL